LIKEEWLIVQMLPTLSCMMPSNFMDEQTEKIIGKKIAIS